MNIKTETWCGYDIRFVEKDGDWWAILKDVCDALDLDTRNVSYQLRQEYEEDENKSERDNVGNTNVTKSDDKTTQKDDPISNVVTKSDKKKSKKDYSDEILAQTLDGEPVLAKTLFEDTLGRLRPTLIVTELGLYDVIFQSRKREAREFKQWVFKALRELRKASGLESYETFRMMDKEHQKKMMAIIKNETQPKNEYSYSNVNQAANRTTSRMYGLDKVLKKGQMTPEMLVDRQIILGEATELTVLKKKYGFDFSVQEKLYQRYPKKEANR